MFKGSWDQPAFTGVLSKILLTQNLLLSSLSGIIESSTRRLLKRWLSRQSTKSFQVHQYSSTLTQTKKALQRYMLFIMSLKQFFSNLFMGVYCILQFSCYASTCQLKSITKSMTRYLWPQSAPLKNGVQSLKAHQNLLTLYQIIKTCSISCLPSICLDIRPGGASFFQGLTLRSTISQKLNIRKMF